VPYVCIAILPRALGVEAIRLSDSARFVVAAYKVDSMWISKLQAYEERYCFYGEKASIDVVT
jgi:hypothetical protein